MMKGLYQYWTDLRSIFRLPLAIGCLCLFFAAMTLADLVNIHTSPINAIFIARMSICPYAICLAILLSIRLYLMDNHLHLSFYPLSFVWMPLGKWLAAMTYMTIYTLITVAIFLENSYFWNIQSSAFWNALGSLLINLELSFAFAISLGLILAAFLRNYWAYLIGFLSWLFASFLIPLLINNQQYLLPFHSTPITNMANGSGPVWGLTLIHQEEKYYWFVLLALTLLCLSGTMLVTMLKTPTKRFLAPLLAFFFAIVFTIASVTAHFQYWNHQFAELKEHHNSAIPTSKAAGYHHTTSLKVTNYRIDLFKDSDIWTMNSQIEVTVLPHPSETKVSFTLNPDFHVEQVTINGKIVDFTRHNSDIELSVNSFNHNGTQQTMSFIYTGHLSEWGANGNGEEEWYAFTKEDAFYLPAYLAWYPLPGRVPLYFEESKNVYQQNIGSAESRDPVTYTVRVHNLDHPIFSTTMMKENTQLHMQILETTNQSGVTLFGGNFKTWESKNVFAVFPAYYDHIRHPLTTKIDSIRDFMQDTFQMPIRGKLVFIPAEGVLKNNQPTEDAFVYPSYKLNGLITDGMDGQIEDEIIDYFLTGGKLLNGASNQARNLNTAYIHVIKGLYQYDLGKKKEIKNKEPLVQQVVNGIDKDHEVLLKEFLRTLIERQKDPKHPIITKEAWNSTWNTIFNGA